MPASNQSDVVRRYYQTDEFLRIREETHEKYTVPKSDFARWTLETLDWSGNETILDLGTGIGTYYSRLMAMKPDVHYYANDLSHQMLMNHPADAKDMSVDDVTKACLLHHVELDSVAWQMSGVHRRLGGT